jgi:hypothetical protein
VPVAEFLRPEARAALWRWREVALAVVVLALGLRWGLTTFGALQIVGWALAVVGASLGVVALRRMRFAQGGGGPGVVQINERRLAYFGPLTGGVIDIDDLIRLELDCDRSSRPLAADRARGAGDPGECRRGGCPVRRLRQPSRHPDHPDAGDFAPQARRRDPDLAGYGPRRSGPGP